MIDKSITDGIYTLCDQLRPLVDEGHNIFNKYDALYHNMSRHRKTIEQLDNALLNLYCAYRYLSYVHVLMEEYK